MADPQTASAEAERPTTAAYEGNIGGDCNLNRELAVAKRLISGTDAKRL